MNRLQLTALGSGLLAATCAPGEPTLDAFWRTDLEQATQAAYETGKPMLVVFR